MYCARFPLAVSVALQRRLRQHSVTCVVRPIFATATNSFDWNGATAAAITHAGDDGSRDLRGYFQRVASCNRGAERQSDFVPFLVDEEVVGYMHQGFVDHIREFRDVFTLAKGDIGPYASGHVALHHLLTTPEDRTAAVAGVIRSLGSLIPGIRNELYPVSSSFGSPVLFSLERAAAPYFGIKAYGVHMNGYVDKSGEKYLWIGKRSDAKATYPGMLDHLVAGGLPLNITCKENLMKECQEEAGIPRSISISATSVGAVSYMDIDGYRYKRDVLFCYDLELPVEFIPKNEDGEVDSFQLIPVADVGSIIRRTECFKPNCTLVIIDFLIRHGYITPDDYGYLKLLQSLRSVDCP